LLEIFRRGTDKFLSTIQLNQSNTIQEQFEDLNNSIVFNVEVRVQQRLNVPWVLLRHSLNVIANAKIATDTDHFVRQDTVSIGAGFIIPFGVDGFFTETPNITYSGVQLVNFFQDIRAVGTYRFTENLIGIF